MRFLQLMVLGLSLSFSHFAKASDQKLASVEISIDDKLLAKNVGVRTLFVIVYDTESKMPMPFGAMKIDLKADAKGSIYKGDLTTANIQRMNPDAPLPKTIRIKARLDKDGSAGMDQAGDLVGIVEKINVGEKTKITINTAI